MAAFLRSYAGADRASTRGIASNTLALCVHRVAVQHIGWILARPGAPATHTLSHTQRLTHMHTSSLTSTRLCHQVAAYPQRRWASTHATPERSHSGRPGPRTKLVPSSLALRWCDLRSPHTQYPHTRTLKRRIILHVGPTNSGKTHAALKRLRESRTGLYCGPLRLLAWEIFERLNEGSTACNLLTGQEREVREGAGHTSCTVEMADTEAKVDVVVLDEIQMIGDESRGWAWTRVLLGARAREIHCCGDKSAVEIVKQIAALTGDEVEVHEYERLSPLSVEPRPISSLYEIRPGDCLVAFSRRELFEHKRRIEASTGLRCGVIYGSLPPAVRREQARRFNSRHGPTSADAAKPADADAPDVLVATDAVGMGLNLAIGRIIFSKTAKFDGRTKRPLTISEIKQIGGRAGRFGSAFPQGYVACLPGSHPGLIRSAMKSDTPRVVTAGLLPALPQLQLFAAALVENAALGRRDGRDQHARDSAEPRRAPVAPLSMPASDSVCAASLDEDDAVAAWMGIQAGHSVLQPAVSTVGSLPIEPGGAVLADEYSDSADEDEDEDDGDDEERLEAAADAATDVVLFSQILSSFLEHARVDGEMFFLCDFTDVIEVARKLDDIDLAFRARYVFCMSPVDTDDLLCVTAIRRYAERFAKRGKVKVGLRVPANPPRTPMELQELESAHAVFDLYLWLAHRFPAEFVGMQQAQAAAQQTQQLIQEGLERIGAEAVAEARARMRAVRRSAAREGVDVANSAELSEYLRTMVDNEDDSDDESDVTMLRSRGRGKPTTTRSRVAGAPKRLDALIPGLRNRKRDVLDSSDEERDSRTRSTKRQKRGERASAWDDDRTAWRDFVARQASSSDRSRSRPRTVEVRQYMRMQMKHASR